MTKQELLDKLEKIKDSMNGHNIINTTGINSICEEITELQWQLNVNTNDFS